MITMIDRIFVVVIMPLIFWGIYKLLRMPAEKAERERQERERQLQQKRAEEQSRREQIRREQEALLEDHRAAREKRRQEIQAVMQRRFDKKHAALEPMSAPIQSYPVAVSEAKAPTVLAYHVDNLTLSTITTRTNMEKLGNFVALDTETTGLAYIIDEIIDVAAIRFRAFQPVESFSILLSASKPIPERASAINHITDEMVAGQPCFQQVAESLVEFIGDDNVVGHNLPFDLKFIVHYGADITTSKRRYFDTLTLAKKTIKREKKVWDPELGEYIENDIGLGVSDYKLGTLCNYFGILNIDAHRAEGDALATGQLFRELAKLRKKGWYD